MIFVELARKSGRQAPLGQGEHAPYQESTRRTGAEFVADAHAMACFDDLPIQMHPPGDTGGLRFATRLEAASGEKETIDAHARGRLLRHGGVLLSSECVHKASSCGNRSWCLVDMRHRGCRRRVGPFAGHQVRPNPGEQGRIGC